MSAPDTPSYIMHEGCDRPHMSLGEMRKCAGRWIEQWEIKRVYLTDEAPRGEA